MIIGYLRVSTGKQNSANQQDEIQRFADSRNLSVNQWVMEVASGKKNGCDRKLGGLIRRMKHGDTLIVTEISRLSRTLMNIMAIMGKCLEKGINLYTTKEGYSFVFSHKGINFRFVHKENTQEFAFQAFGWSKFFRSVRIIPLFFDRLFNERFNQHKIIPFGF